MPGDLVNGQIVNYSSDFFHRDTGCMRTRTLDLFAFAIYVPSLHRLRVNISLHQSGDTAPDDYLADSGR